MVGAFMLEKDVAVLALEKGVAVLALEKDVAVLALGKGAAALASAMMVAFEVCLSFAFFRVGMAACSFIGSSPNLEKTEGMIAKLDG
jgi:hypothetical protein